MGPKRGYYKNNKKAGDAGKDKSRDEGSRESEVSKKKDSTIAMLFPPDSRTGSPGNMAKFFETLDRYLTESSEFVYTKRFFAIEYSGVMVLKAPEEFDDANPTYFVKTKYENDLKDYYRKKGIQDSELISIFGLMKSNLSDRSQDIFREKDNAVKWGECLAEQNPKKLKALIESTHIHQLSGDDKYDELENLTKYGNLKQGKDTLMHFREKHIRALKILDAAAGVAVAGTPAASRQGEWDIGKPHKLVTEQTQAKTFLKGLDPNRYGTMMCDLENMITFKKTTDYPKTFLEAYSYANNYKTVIRKVNDSGELLSTFVSSVNPSGRGQGGRGNGERGGRRGRGGKNGRGGRGRGANSDGKVICYNCGEEGHIRPNCPKKDSDGDRTESDVKQVMNEKKQEKSTTLAAKMKELSIDDNAIIMMAQQITYIDKTVCNDSDDLPNLFDDNEEVGGKNEVSLQFPETPIHDGDDNDVVLSANTLEIFKRNEKISFMYRWCDTDIMLDSCSNASIIKNVNFLSDITKLKRKVTINGVGGEVEIQYAGEMLIFGRVLYCKNSVANILSCSIVSNMKGIQVTFDQKKNEFRIRAGRLVYVFKSIDNLYICRNTDSLLQVSNKRITLASHIADVDTNRSNMTIQEAKRADEAALLKRRMGGPNDQSFIDMIQGGMKNASVTRNDLANAKLLSSNREELAGKTKFKPQPLNRFDYVTNIPASIKNKVKAWMDLMTIGAHVFLVTVLEFDYTLGTYLGNKKHSATKSSNILWKAISKQLSSLKKDAIEIGDIVIDGESGVQAIEQRINDQGVTLSPAPTTHIGQVEKKIQHIETTWRALWAGLPYGLCIVLQVFLTLFVIRCINLMPSKKNVDRVSGYTMLTHKIPDVKIHFKVGFGEYCMTTVPKHWKWSDVDHSRTEDVVSLLPMDNEHGSVKFLNLSTMKVITRDTYRVLPMPTSVIAHLNTYAIAEGGSLKVSPLFGVKGRVLGQTTNDDIPIKDDGDYSRHEAREALKALPDVSFTDNDHHDHEEVIIDYADNQPVEVTQFDDIRLEEKITSDERGEINFENIDEEENQPLQEGVDDADDDKNVEDAVPEEQNPGVEDQGVPSTQEPPEVVVPPRRAGLRQRAVYDGLRWQERKIGLHMSVNKALNTLKKPALRAIIDELEKNAEEKLTFHPVRLKDLTKKQLKGIIRSSMILKEKFKDVNGVSVFEKVKARLVAGGHMQDRDMYDDVSSPTVSLTSVFTIAAIAAKERRKTITMDIGTAYLNAEMPKEQGPVLMSLDKRMAAILAAMYPERYSDFVNPDGTIVVELDKALYGCIQSAKLWYEHMRNTLEELDFKVNMHDICVFNKVHQRCGKQITITLHVDDIMMTSVSEEAMNEIVSALQDKYKSVQVTKGSIHAYLGMRFDYSVVDKVTITMGAYTKDMLSTHMIEGTASTPALENLFVVREDAKLLPEEGRKLFHTQVAKLLYLAKRTRPEILPAVVFLTSRVTKADEDDELKLMRIMKYLNGSVDLGITLRANDPISVIAFIDAAAYAVHADYRGHTGGYLSLGSGPVFVKSSKQKINTKSSTEAELIALSDSSSQVIWLRDFLIAQGYEAHKAEIYQDNMSTIALIEKGRSTSEKSRHINIRFFFLKDRIDANEIKISYKPTENMIADILTKPLQGNLFRKLRSLLLGMDDTDEI